MKWFTSDLHFAHPFVVALRGYALPGYARDESIKQQAEHDGRQLKDCVDWRKHDADIVQAINTYVGREDELYILGDISSGSTWSVDQAIMRIQNLQVPRKRRHLILGNHELYASSRTLEKLASVFGEVGRVGITEIRDGRGNNPHTVFLGSVKPTLTYERGALIREEVQTFSLWPLLLNGYRYSKARGVHVQHQCSGCGS